MDFGGGSTKAPGHGRPMQENGLPKPILELSEETTWEHFWSKYVRANQPVVLRGHATKQRAYHLWTDEYLRKQWGSKVVSVEVNKSEERGGPSTEMPFQDFLKKMYKDEHRAQFYAIVNFDDDMTARADFDLPEPFCCKEVAPQSLTLWMSSGGTTSVLHEDDAENVLMLLAGRKKVMLVHQDEARNIYSHIPSMGGTSPVHQDAVDLEAFPRFANVSWLQGELGPGDMLYIPHSYWHQVVSDERNVAVNLWWGHRIDWRWWDPHNRQEYNPGRFGFQGFPHFNDLKARGPEAAPCTPLPFTKRDLTSVKFVDEERWKQYIRKKRRIARKRGEL